MSATRVCRTCQVEKPIDQFRLRSEFGYRYRYHECRACQCAYKRARYIPHPRLPAQGPKVCRVCGKAITKANQRTDGRYVYPDCRPCHNDGRRMTDADWTRVWKADYQAILARVATVTREVPIPPSDPWIDLAVIAACWGDCVAVGPEAITRMVKRIAATCWSIGGRADRLHAAATGYLDGLNGLAMVQGRLDDLAGLAVAS